MQIAVAEHISVPAEWAPQKAMWTAWPADPDQWSDDLATPRREVAALVRALSPSNRVRLLVAGDEAESSARAALGNAAELVPARYGDIWLRDTGPIFARGERGPVALRFMHQRLGRQVRSARGQRPSATTSPSLPARRCANSISSWRAGLSSRTATARSSRRGRLCSTTTAMAGAKPKPKAALREAFGAKKILWLDRGLLNDHTDGHIDTLARFVGPGRVVCQSPAGADDPNAKVLNEIARMLEAATDAVGRKLEVIRIPSPGLVLDDSGETAPASHVNFVIANGIVVMPIYGTRDSASKRCKRCKRRFPTARSIGLPSRGVLGSGLAGGGSFHCITRRSRSDDAAYAHRRRDPDLLRPRHAGQYRQDRSARPRGGEPGRAGHPAVGAVPGASTSRRGKTRTGSPPPTLARASLRCARLPRSPRR